ncbi:hypothetical protein ONS95_000136 [Cadophora gregata]|uniref:uncharacterized protein n=1 Tax=Cadophora gregata TaxID=51156 RepID=UPI0026DBDD78|nr:uncharacterized protein ONS95_000136 [Cadophora gregata]KAK0115591.1 hypothetical protein ONS96_014041 [Cadophora gregata f. sp. sojae]KAK0128153.1 hypothetical protein ONS95_000136 [Cadophora gregata]
MNCSSSPTRSTLFAVSANSWDTERTIPAHTEDTKPSTTIRDTPSFNIPQMAYTPQHTTNTSIPPPSIAGGNSNLQSINYATFTNQAKIPRHASTFPASRPESIASKATTNFSLHGSQTLVPEQYWSPHASGGIRTDLKLRRGILTHCTPGSGGHFQANIERILRYTFQNGDLLEEALESPGSGITCVGKTYRQCEEGNKHLAQVGKKVLKLVILDQCYTFRINSQKRIVNDMIGRSNLFKVGKNTKIESWVRNKMPKQEGKTRNPFRLLVDDVRTEDATRTIERAMQAIIGAVYFDGGFEAARRVMAQLGLTIKAGNEQDRETLVEVGFSTDDGKTYQDDNASGGSVTPLLK